jgi:hypothetical protein
MKCELLKQRLEELEKRRLFLDHKDRFTLADKEARDRLSYEINKIRNILKG